ncbi:MAG: hypothetical protein JW953_21680, partial [Anaerolineae bacterium]|nr:hypothetical protein [Anaerolineae bacterium]
EQPPAPDQPQPPADQPLPATSTDEPLPEQPTGEQPVLEPTSPLSMPFPESLIPNNDSVEAAPEQEADPDATNLVLDEAEFIDTIIVGGAYLWRCCGVFIILLIPLLFLLLYIRGRSKIIQEEDF